MGFWSCDNGAHLPDDVLYMHSEQRSSLPAACIAAPVQKVKVLKLS